MIMAIGMGVLIIIGGVIAIFGVVTMSIVGATLFGFAPFSILEGALLVLINVVDKILFVGSMIADQLCNTLLTWFYTFGFGLITVFFSVVPTTGTNIVSNTNQSVLPENSAIMYEMSENMEKIYIDILKGLGVSDRIIDRAKNIKNKVKLGIEKKLGIQSKKKSASLSALDFATEKAIEEEETKSFKKMLDVYGLR